MKGGSFFNDSGFLVDQMCKSLARQNPDLRYDATNRVVFRPISQEAPKVSVVSGGGSGHEPAHAGYVGEGMLDAAVCGKIFASPNFDQIMSAFDRIATPQGILVIVKNYTGDRLNFGLAAETYQAQTGTPVKLVTMADDVSVPRSRGKMVGRRGIAGVVLVHKVSGAAAARGLALPEIAELAQHVADNTATVGCSLDFCSVPGATVDQAVPPDTIELGMGIHNEPGAQRISPQPDIKDLVGQMLKLLLDETNPEHGFLTFGQVPREQAKIVLLVNNLGGISVLELQAIANIVVESLKTEYGIAPCRMYVNTYLTALDAPGFSITLSNLSSSASISDGDLLSLLDEPVKISSWSPSQVPAEALEEVEAAEIQSKKPQSPGNGETMAYDEATLKAIVEAILAEVKLQESLMTEYDMLMGDGDCGTTLLAGAQAAYAVTQQSTVQGPPADLSSEMIKIATSVRSGMGGTSGALYGIFLSSFVSAMKENHRQLKNTDIQLFAKSASQALESLKTYTSARENGRTLMDALIPYVNDLSTAVFTDNANTVDALQRALEAAKKGAEATKWMQSSFGRSTYVGAGSESENPTWGIPDPGAWGIVAVVQGIYNALSA
ncbi:Dak1 domain-containing protein [Aspergillus stella-maris]|uniref:Dak1 domain-containing protein n=1 Tax=Aspergillus stella-maris TaxID=1810926 RepID=UPI003CCDB0DC